jgi:serine phosphatase RsbU (regulator of sigma subunit)
VYSDGVVEAMNASDEEFGEERLRSVIRENLAKSPAKIRDEILKQVRFFLGEEQPQDDLTLVVARIRLPVLGIPKLRSQSNQYGSHLQSGLFVSAI